MKKFGMICGWLLSKVIIAYVAINSYFSIRDHKSIVPEISALFAYFTWRNTMRLAYGQALIYSNLSDYKKEVKENDSTKFYRLKGE